MLSYYFVTRLYNLKVSRVMNKGIKLMMGHRISNGPEPLKEFDNLMFKYCIGSLEYDALFEGPYIYHFSKMNNIDVSSNPARDRALMAFLGLVQLYCTSLWVVKDNSINTEMSFLLVKEREPFTTANYHPVHFSNSAGEFVETSFSDDELKSAARICTILYLQNIPNEAPSDDTVAIIGNRNRIDRFMHYIQAARNESYLPLKIAHYCTLLETLLSTEKQEITHIIAERVAKLIGSSIEERLETYKFIKTAYGVRSATVHGSKVDKVNRNTEKLKIISGRLDGILRRLLVMILADEEIRKIYFDDDDDKLRQWLLKVILK